MHGSTRERTGMTDCRGRPGAGRQVGPHVPLSAGWTEAQEARSLWLI